MFRCAKCGEMSEPRERPIAVVTKTRDKEYPARDYVTKEGFVITDPGGYGQEIVKEERVCRDCYEGKVARA